MLAHLTKAPSCHLGAFLTQRWSSFRTPDPYEVLALNQLEVDQRCDGFATTDGTIRPGGVFQLPHEEEGDSVLPARDAFYAASVPAMTVNRGGVLSRIIARTNASHTSIAYRHQSTR